MSERISFLEISLAIPGSGWSIPTRHGKRAGARRCQDRLL